MSGHRPWENYGATTALGLATNPRQVWAASMTKQRSGIHLIAEMANVSIGTVDRALHGRPGIKDATRQRILEIAQQIGYIPNLAARALSVAKSTARIGVCMPREIHFFYDQLWAGVL